MKRWKPYDWLAMIVVVLVVFAGMVMFSPVEHGSLKRTDAFLDQPLPPGFVPHVFDSHIPDGVKPTYAPDWVSYGSYQERLDALKTMTPRNLILPEGFSDFIAKVNDRSDWNRGPVLFTNERDGIGGGGKTYRDFMTQSFKVMGLELKYDPARNALVADFPWHHVDPRSSQELLQALKATKPIAMKIDDLHADIDPWRTVFDSLLSKPENFSDAWKLRFLDDARGRRFSSLEQSGVIVWVGELPDQKAKPHFVVINYHPGSMFYGNFDCYVFTPNGRFEYGAVLMGPYRTEGLPHVNLQPSGKSLTIWFDDGYRKAYGTLGLEREGVIFHDSDVMNCSCIGVPLYRTETMLN